MCQPFLLLRIERAQSAVSLTAGKHSLPYSGREILLHHSMLRKISDPGAFKSVTRQYSAGHRLYKIENAFHKRGFT